MASGILWPTFALVGLIWIVWLVMFIQRSRLMKRTPPTAEDFATGEAAKRYFRPAEMPANNFTNLFELPVLYFALVPLLMITEFASPTQVLLAWLYVVLRAAHSYVQIALRRVPLRFSVYLASAVVLSAMWIGFFIDMIRAN